MSINNFNIMTVNKKYKEKQDIWVPYIQTHLHAEEFSAEDLANHLVTGGCMRTGILVGGRGADKWVEQQVFALDFDEDANLKESYDKAIELGIIPAFCYHTYSSTPAQEKYRFVFVNDYVIYDGEKRDKLQALLMGLWGNIDTRCFNRDRIFFGTYSKEVIHPNYDVTVNADEIIDKYWDDVYYKYYSEAALRKINRRKDGSEVIRKTKIAKIVDDLIDVVKKPKEKKIFNYQVEDDHPWLKKPARDTTNFNIKCLEKLFEEQIWVEGCHRERFLFIAYNCHKALYGSLKAYEKICEYNNNMLEPIEEYYLNMLVMHTDNHIECTTNHDDGIFTFAPQTIIDTLELTNDLAEECGFLDGEKAKEKKINNRVNKIIRNQIIEEKLNEDMLPSDIVDFLASYEDGLYKCSIRTVYNVKNELMEKMSISSTAVAKMDITTNENLYNQKNINNDRFISDEYEELYNQYLELEQQADENEQDNIINELLNDYTSNFLITGKAGTGKTFLIESYLEQLPAEERDKTVIVAPTGIAACNFKNAHTIHNYFHLGVRVFDARLHPKDCCSKLIDNNVQRIIIDEVSMLRKDVFDMVMTLIDNTKRNCYFPKFQIIMLGDWTQLPPVVKDADKDRLDEIYLNSIGNYHCYDSNLWDKLDIKSRTLYKSKRLNSNDFNALFEEYLKKLQFGCLSALRWLNENLSHKEDEEAIYICPNNRIVDKYNKKYIRTFDADTIKIFERIPFDDEIPFYWNNDEQVPELLEFAVGMKVMTLVNRGKYKNGSIGVITDINGRKISIKLDATGELVTVTDTLYQDDNGNFYLQLPLRIAKAITVHKSQGLTFDKVNIVTGFFGPAQLYVALSRCKEAKNINLIGNINEKEVICDLESQKKFIDLN